jgi:hypothetical protein
MTTLLPDDATMQQLLAVAFKINDVCGSFCCDFHKHKFLRELIAGATVVWAFWPHKKDPDGFNCMIIKGHDLPTGEYTAGAILVDKEKTAKLIRDNWVGGVVPAPTHTMPPGVM